VILISIIAIAPAVVTALCWFLVRQITRWQLMWRATVAALAAPVAFLLLYASLNSTNIDGDENAAVTVLCGICLFVGIIMAGCLEYRPGGRA
jgi:hypothetical protein